jgi:hypothetical protein
MVLVCDILYTGVEVKDLHSKQRASVHSRLGAPLAVVTRAASPAAVTADTRIARVSWPCEHEKIILLSLLKLPSVAGNSSCEDHS